jgi:hypothetical protein
LARTLFLTLQTITDYPMRHMQRPKCSPAVLGVTSATRSGPAYYPGSIPFAL